MTFATRDCPACEASIVTPLFYQSFAQIQGISILDGYHVVACDGCGMVYADTIPPQAQFDAYYAAASKYEYPHRAGAESLYDITRFTEVADLIEEWYPDKTAKILDVGCSSGGLLRVLQGRGYMNLTGLDPSTRCVQAAHERHGLDVRQGTLDGLEAWGESYDLMILVGVLEHVRDVQRLLRVIRSRLRPHGALFLDVPDARRFDVFPDAPFQAFSTEHINFFTAASLVYALQGAGFTVNERNEIEENAREQSATVTLANLSALARATSGDEIRVPDRGGRHAIERYIANETHREQRIRLAITALAGQRTPLLAWGCGSHALRLLATTRLSDAPILGFIDSNPRYQNQHIGRFPILSPAALYSLSDVPVLILSTPFRAEIRAQLRSMGAPNPVLTLDEPEPAR